MTGRLSRPVWMRRSAWKAAGRICPPGVALLLNAALHAGELLELSVTEAGDEYSLRTVAMLDAPSDYVYRVVTDYRHAYRINPAITTIEILPATHQGATRVKNHSEHRIGLFSFEINWVGDVMEEGQGRVDIITLPDASSFHSGSAVWDIRPRGDRTWVLHESTLKPKFFILPVIGNYLMKKHMRRETVATLHRIECHAQLMLERDLQDNPRMQLVLNEKRDCVAGHGRARDRPAQQR